MSANTNVPHEDQEVPAIWKQSDLSRWPKTISLSWSERFAHRLAMHLPVAPFFLRNAKPLISFTFDDVPASASTLGASLLVAHGVKGTFYISAAHLGERTPFWTLLDSEGITSLSDSNHEIGCHTYSHTPVTELNRAMLRNEIQVNGERLKRIVPKLNLLNFAYPFGVGTWSSKLQLRKLFDSSRSIVPGINRNVVDLHFLRAVPLCNDQITPTELERVLDKTVVQNGWLIFYTHDISERPSTFGCTPNLLVHALESAIRRGIVPLTITEALQAVGYRSARGQAG